MIVMRCSSCGGQINATPDLAGSFIACPSCGNDTLIPTMQAPPTSAGTGAGGMSGVPGDRGARARGAPPTRASSLNFGSTIAPGQAVPACSRIVYIVLAVFLGQIGIHNFVAGRTGVAVAQLVITVTCFVLFFCTFGLSAFGAVGVAVWALIEAVVVTEDGRGVRMN